MCLVEREEAQGRPNVEKAAKPAPFISIFTANDVREKSIQLALRMRPLFAFSCSEIDSKDSEAK